MKKIYPIGVLTMLSWLCISANCSKLGDTSNNNNNDAPDIVAEYWVTKADQTVLLQKQGTITGLSNSQDNILRVDVDSTTAFQAIDGFGYTLTGGSAMLIDQMNGTEKANVLNDLFGSNGIGVSYLRVSIGASDLSSRVFSYDDMPAGQTDATLAHFSLADDTLHLIPVLKQILSINPNIRILGSPWSPPVWMKDNGSSIGGSLKPEYYAVYAKYFIKYLQAMKDQGITIDAITIQNEPQHGGNNPSMVMSALQQADFVKNHLGPAFQSANIKTKIIIWDHNCDNANYPITILNDAAAKAFVDGSAFHLYAGDISALSTVKTTHPDKNLYFTEQWTGSKTDFGTDLLWHTKNVIIGSMRNWSRVALEWNLASDPSFNPHTPGGCTECKGALTISGSGAQKNVSYYIIAHASKFVPAGSVRIQSTNTSSLPNVAFKRPDGKKVLIVLNEGANAVNFNIKYKNKWMKTSLPGRAAGTYVW